MLFDPHAILTLHQVAPWLTETLIILLALTIQGVAFSAWLASFRAALRYGR
jgi:hypothetical protein